MDGDALPLSSQPAVPPQGGPIQMIFTPDPTGIPALSGTGPLSFLVFLSARLFCS